MSRLSPFYLSCFELIAESMRRIKGKNWKDSFFKQVEISRLDGNRGNATDETFGLLWGQFGMCLGHFGHMMRWLWVTSGSLRITFGSFWAHFVVSLDV